MVRVVFVLVFLLSAMSASSLAQTGSTGAIAGTVRDQTGATVPEAQVITRSVATNEVREVTTQANGAFVFPLLSPGEYVLEVTMGGFKTVRREGIRVNVTETANVSVELQVEGVADTVQVSATAEIVQARSSTLGRVVDSRAVESLPLVTRNFTQIIGLSPGITTDVTDAGALGRGTGSTSPPNAHGNRSYDNNFQMNGLGVNDIFMQGTTSGGVPVPNPDTILEFKVQTGQYDAAFGRNAGANVNLVTKSGTNRLTGSAFEFFRDRSLNANSFFSNRNGQPKPILDQNQFGFTLGGPVIRDRILYFGSYQGTRQTNGVSGLVTVLSPPLTDDRSAAALGRLFAGQRGVQQNAMGGVGPAILPDGSNINPVALRLLQLRAPDGTYVIPTPQRVNPAAAFAVQGSSTFSTPSTFDEDQYMANVDYVHTSSSRYAGRLFTAGGETLQAFPAGNTPGFPLTTDDRYVAASVAHSWVLSSRLFNEARFGYGLLRTDRSPASPFRFSDVGIAAAPQANDLPTITITGSYSLASTQRAVRSQRTFLFEDSLSWVVGAHNIQVGGGVTRALRDFTNLRQPGQLTFQSFPDFLLGLNAAQNGTNLFSNVFVSVDLTGQFDRASRNWEALAYVQDSFQVSSRLTLNAGVRYEYLPPLTDATGRPTTVDPNALVPNPPAAGSLAGIVVPANYPGTIPAGVIQTGSDTIMDAARTHTVGPRAGFAWRVFGEGSRVVMRGGYGLYFSRTTGQVQTQTTTTQPFGLLRVSAGPPNAAATFASPFASPIPTEASFPLWVPYTPTSNLTATAVSRDLSPAHVQQFSLGIQTEIARDLMWEIGYVGTRGDRLQRSRSVNQALLASPSNPIRGVTTNTVANIADRKPFLGWSTSDLRAVESEGEMVYDGLETSVTKRYRRGLQFLASYTYSKTIDSDGANAEANGQAGAGIGNQNDDRARRGPASFSRPHRFVASFIYDLPGMTGGGVASALLSGWSLAGVATFQSGQPLTFTGTNANNAFGFTPDRAQLAPGCGNGDLVLGGSVKDRLTRYFNTACVGPTVAWPVIGNDGRATDFGNSGVGIVRGPGQRNLDLSLAKRTRVGWPTSAGQAEFRAEFFNALNTVNFANPNTNVSAATFGQITATSVSPRIIQLAVRFIF